MKRPTRIDALGTEGQKIEGLCRAVVRARPVSEAPPWFASRVMAHARERAEAALENWFIRRVVAPLLAGGGLASAGLALSWIWLARFAALSEWMEGLTATHWLNF